MLTEKEFALVSPLIHGAVSVQNTQNGLVCLRFSSEQASVYGPESVYYSKLFATSGITLETVTDARRISLDYHISEASSRSFYYFDVLVNGVLVKHDGAESFAEKPDGTLDVELDGAVNSVVVYFPCLVQAVITAVRMEGATRIEPVVRRATMVCHGDSITQGYDARFPSLCYPAQLGAALNMEVINKGIGGARFNGDLAAAADGVEPDVITVAYGTNDWTWSRQTRESFERSVHGFFEALSERFPASRIVVILPLWRTDADRLTAVGSFADAAAFIRKACEGFAGTMTVDGFGLLPHVPEVLSDNKCHPNDLGFQFMGRRLAAEIQACHLPGWR